MAHNNYGSPHINAANNAVGSYFYNDFGWGMMKGGGPNVFDCASGWERWYNGWIELTTSANQVNSQIDTITDLQNGGIYTLRDFITTDDVIRVKLPHVSNQYLWLENHTGKNNFDKRSGWAINGVGNPFPAEPRGLVGYVEGVRYARTFTGGAGTGVNAIKHLNALGNFDYTNPFLNPEPTAPEMFWLITYDFTKGMANPLGAHNQLVNIRNNFSNAASTDTIDYDSYFNGGGSLNENRMFNKENGIFTYGSFGMGMSFPQGAKVDLGSNPVITNLQAYNSFAKQLSPIYLNGISFEVLSYNPDSSVTIKIRMDDYDVNNDTHYTGEIALSPNVVSSANYSLNLKASKTLDIDKSGTPNRHTQTINYDFINPTVFTCNSGSYFHVEPNATVNVQNGSTLKLTNGSKMELESGARLFIHENSSLIIEDGAELNLKPGAILIIEEGATVYYNNNQAGKGLLVGATSISGHPTAARVDVKGNMVFDANAKWVHNRDGVYSFFPTHQLTMPNTVEMNFTGKGKNHLMIYLAQNTTLLLENIKVVFFTGMIYYDDNSTIQLNGVDYTSVLTTYNPSYNIHQTGTGLDVTNPVSFFLNGCDFNYLDTGIKIEQASPTVIVQATKMTGVGHYNYYLDGLDVISITGGVLDEGVYGVFALNTKVLKVTNTEIKNMQTSGANLEEVYGAYFSNTKIHTNMNGIYSTNSLVFLRNGAKVYENQDYGIDMYGVYDTQTKSFSTMLTIGDEGCGSVYDNASTGIKTKNTLLNIDAVQHSINRQDNDTIPNQFYGNGYMFDICYSNVVRSAQINAKGNYWGTNPPIQSSEYTIVANYCPGDQSTPQNLSLISSNYSTCYSSTTCMDCSSGSSSSMLVSQETPSVESVVQESFTEANLPFIGQDNATTRNEFLDLSSIDLIKDTVTNTWTGISVNNQAFALTNKSVHHIQVAKAIKAKATNSNMRVNTAPKDIFAGITQNANALNSKVQVYPNPVNSELTISIEDVSGIYLLNIYQISGKLIIEEKLNKSLSNIDVSLLENGIYFYEIISENGERLTGKVSVVR
ncbi:MAG: T9SS type A sorting domain-containing protein [Vicingaceae bacterium]|nr:T9SS type A sorting domain-containing protein [Vicingaceae bacterium]